MNLFINDLVQFRLMGYTFKFYVFFLLRTTIDDSSKYLIQLTQYYHMSKINKIDSFNNIDIIF